MSSINESERIVLFVPMDFSAEEFTESCGKFLADVRKEMTEFENAVDAFAQSLKRS